MSLISGYMRSLREILEGLGEPQIEPLVDALEAAWRDGRRVLLMGNGGSSATASHIVNDLQKCIQLESGRPLKAMCLSDNTPLVLAWANDTDYANVFQPQVECWVEPGDLVIGISGSGNSPNVIRGIEAAKERGAQTYGLAGFSGGQLAQVVDQGLVVPSDSMQQIEDVHMVVLHVAFVALLERVRVAAG